jgi:2-polyprenyl-3-methyl-5-hydroxy-6-metoxy-1,4-benzoquinol methylase
LDVQFSGVDAGYTSADHSFRENDPYARAKYALTLRWLAPHMHPGDLLYNIGVGSGYFNHLAAARGLRVVGCEPDVQAFDAARRTAPPGVELLNLTLEEFARDRTPSQIVVMHDVLEHIEDDSAAVHVLRQIVARDGRVVLSVPALQSLFGLHDEQLGHYRRYTAASLRRVLEPEFVIRRLKWYGLASIPIAFYFSRYKRIAYPIGATRSFVGDVYGRVCELESRLPVPLGTSLVAEITPRS